MISIATLEFRVTNTKIDAKKTNFVLEMSLHNTKLCYSSTSAQSFQQLDYNFNDVLSVLGIRFCRRIDSSSPDHGKYCHTTLSKVTLLFAGTPQELLPR
jgi:hypothetical protein